MKTATDNCSPAESSGRRRGNGKWRGIALVDSGVDSWQSLVQQFVRCRAGWMGADPDVRAHLCFFNAGPSHGASIGGPAHCTRL